MFIDFEPDDYSMVVKNRAKPPKPWRWEIYRAGRDTAIDQSPVSFETVSMAHRAGKEAIKLFLAKRYAPRRVRQTLARNGLKATPIGSTSARPVASFCASAS